MRTPAGVFDVLVDGPSDGAAVLLLHGFPQDATAWSAQLAALGAAGHRVVAVDQRGYSPGARPAGPDAYRLELLVGDVLAVADALGLRRFGLAGHDWGGAVAWSVAAEHPDRVRALAVVSTPHGAALGDALRTDPEQRARFGYQADLRRAGVEDELLADGSARLRAFYQGRVPAERADAYVRRLSRPGALTAALQWYRAPRPPSPGPVGVPTLYVWSTEDLAFGRRAAEGTAARVTGEYRFVELAGVSHWVPEEAPEELSALLLGRFAAR